MAIRALSPEDPTSLGPYRLTGRLGSGGMGVVYLGFGEDGNAVAVKTLRAGADPEARTRMRREAEHMAAVTSPRLARFVAADTAGDTPWIALGYVAGPSLAEAPLPLSDAGLRSLAGGLAEAVAALHAAGIVHRDIKPGNVILSFDGPVLVDLGIARTGDATSMTQVGMTIGSPGWMSPEQLRGTPPTNATDVWGWGAVLAFAATGRAPFGEGELAPLALRIQTAEADLAGVPNWLEPAVRTALAKDPAQRALPAGPPPEPSLGAPPPTRASMPVVEAPPAALAVPPVLPRAPQAPRSGAPAALWALVAVLVAALAVAGIVVVLNGAQVTALDGDSRARVTARVTADPSAAAPPPGRTEPATAVPTRRPTPVAATTAQTRARTRRPALPSSAPPAPAPKPRTGSGWTPAQVTAELSRKLTVATGRRMVVRCPEAVVATGRYLRCTAASADASLDNVAADVLILDAQDRRLAYNVGESVSVAFAPNMSCRDFAMMAEPYFTSVAYWFESGRPARHDADGNGRPCETVYPADQVAQLWRGD